MQTVLVVEGPADSAAKIVELQRGLELLVGTIGGTTILIKVSYTSKYQVLNLILGVFQMSSSRLMFLGPENARKDPKTSENI